MFQIKVLSSVELNGKMVTYSEWVKIWQECPRNSVGIATGYVLERRGSIFGSGKGFFLRHSVKTGSGAHPASYPSGTRVLPQGVKRPGPEDAHLPPSSAEVKNSEAIISSPIRA
jgi:hypothetical protein